MKPSSFPCSLAWLVLAASVSAQGSPGGELRRVAPFEEKPRDLYSGPFQRDEWRARLAEPALDRREESFDALLRRARLDPAARVFLEELARDPSGGELAWTARLGLRALAGLPAPGRDRFGRSARLGQVMEELLARDPAGLLWMPPGVQELPPGPEARSGRCVRLEQDARGARVCVTETSAEGADTRTYEGPTIEQILAQNPELRADLDGLRVQHAALPLDLSLTLDGSDSDGADAGLRRWLAQSMGLRLAPQGRSRPVVTDRLGVLVRPLSAAERGELAVGELGLLVLRSFPETYAHLLGVRSGAVLLALDGAPLKSVSDLEQAMRRRGSEDRLTLLWMDELRQRRERSWQAESR